MDDTDFMRRAIELSRQALDRPGLRPYGAVVVKDGRIVGEGVNQAPGKNDPTSHGEVEAIRAACAALATTDLTGCAVYTSCEPCSMCVATMLLTNIDRVVYAASLEDSAAAYAAVGQRPQAISSLEIRAEVAKPIHDRRIAADRLLADEATPVIRSFAAALD
jgi:tRNA(Arg) A34 adenosine deaminase TadA